MTDRRRRAAPSDNPSGEDNPFAPPPEDRPDQPWQPRRPHRGGEQGESDGEGNGQGSGDEGRSGSENGQSPWSSQWSSRQPGRGSGGFGSPTGGGSDGDGRGGQQRGLRWDPTDRYQRHARYSLHTGIWALFFALFSLWQVALLLGALSVHWGVSALRHRPGDGEKGKDEGRAPQASAADVAGTDRKSTEEGGSRELPVPVSVTPAQAAKAKTTAAVSGLVTAGLALCVVAATFTFQAVYQDYFDCRQDALTQSSRDDCDRLVPDNLRPFLEDR